MILAQKLADRVLERIKSEDDRAIEMMSSGMLTDWGQYQRSAGYRKALSDFQIITTETLEEILKE